MPGQLQMTEDFARTFLICVGGFNFCAEFGKNANGGGGHGEASVGQCRLLWC